MLFLYLNSGFKPIFNANGTEFDALSPKLNSLIWGSYADLSSFLNVNSGDENDKNESPLYIGVYFISPNNFFLIVFDFVNI